MSSWLTELAGKAENILNKIDQNAATVLQIPNQISSDSVEENQLVEIAYDNSENSGSKQLTLLSPKRMGLKSIKSDSSINSENYNNASSTHSRISSSSLSQSQDGTGTGTVIEKETSENKSIVDNPKKLPLTVEKELAALKIVLIEVRSERDELKTEIENLMETMKLTNNQSRVTELEDFCIKLEQERDKIMENNAALDIANTKYIKSISELEGTISKLHQHETDLTEKLQLLSLEKDQCFSELQQYRTRAQANLQMKEKMIQDLKNNLNSTDKLEEFEIKASALELESIKTENETLNNQLMAIKSQLEQLKFYNTTNEEKYRTVITQLEEKHDKVTDNFKNEQKRSRHYEDELKLQSQELVSVREEIVRLRSNMSKNLYEKELELTKLKTKLSQQTEYTMSNGVEERLQMLTQSLVHKQSALETLTAEKNAMKLQMEKVENQHRTTIMQIRQQRPQILNMNVTDDAKAQVPNFLLETPFDTTVARRVKRAYSSLDSVSIRLGVFLRRFPLVRILVIFYMVILHLWVLVVLLSSTPPIHK